MVLRIADFIPRLGARRARQRPFGSTSLTRAAPPSLHRLNALDQVGEARAIFVPDRLHRLLERLLVGDLEDLNAGRLRLLDRLLLVGGPERALLDLRLARES